MRTKPRDRILSALEVSGMRSRTRSIVTATRTVVATLAASTVSWAEGPITEAPALAASPAITVDIEQLE